MREAVDAPRVRDEVALLALFESRTSHLCYRLDRYAQAERLAAQALDRINPGQPDSVARVQALTVLAASALRFGRLGEAQRRYEQRLARVRSEGRLPVIEADVKGGAMPVLATSSPTAKGATRRWQRTDEFVREVSDARVHGGIHFRSATNAAEAMGRRIGELAVQQVLRPAP